MSRVLWECFGGVLRSYEVFELFGGCMGGCFAVFRVF
jgi:hypothetical protein